MDGQGDERAKFILNWLSSLIEVKSTILTNKAKGKLAEAEADLKVP